MNVKLGELELHLFDLLDQRLWSIGRIIYVEDEVEMRRGADEPATETEVVLSSCTRTFLSTAAWAHLQ